MSVEPSPFTRRPVPARSPFWLYVDDTRRAPERWAQPTDITKTLDSHRALRIAIDRMTLGDGRSVADALAWMRDNRWWPTAVYVHETHPGVSRFIRSFVREHSPAGTFGGAGLHWGPPAQLEREQPEFKETAEHLNLRPDEVVRLAAELRAEHAGPGGLPWSKLTDAQKVPWIVRAAQSPARTA
ncbi:hypothetical protein [Prescottella equi]|uniref:hypothetical protein n=1 Tax=Rhodococcus hoagii TaxID=43767 RepID=UPI000D10C71F|nr:hypothetical protein [Prescottella equi]AVP71282.1 hypothetical protein C7H75_24685 [Prescottella equi]